MQAAGDDLHGESLDFEAIGDPANVEYFIDHEEVDGALVANGVDGVRERGDKNDFGAALLSNLAGAGDVSLERADNA